MKSRFARRSVLSLALVLGLSSLAHADVTLLNVSYDPTRELYQEYNAPSPSTGRPRTTKPSPSSSPMAALASRPAR
jgi:ABC-type sulfate transport system substrate-binding protein